MHRIFQCLTVFCLLFSFILLSGCTERQQNELSVFAAISLTDALTEIGEAFTLEHHIKIYYNFAASTTLQRQLEKGASADVFISASPRQVAELEFNGLIDVGSLHDLLTNRLVLVCHETALTSVETLDAFVALDISRIAIGHPDIVPAGAYAKEALTHAGVWETLQPKMIFGTDVRATLAYLTAGNVDAAIVYKTDTTLTPNIKVVYQFPSDAYTPITYPAVVLKGSQRGPFARKFVAYLRSAGSRKIFEKHGFTVLALK